MYMTAWEMSTGSNADMHFSLEQRLGLAWGKLARPGEGLGQGASYSKVKPAVVRDKYEIIMLQHIKHLYIALIKSGWWQK